jgi:membrane complex biogenesis BtpA family protein
MPAPLFPPRALIGMVHVGALPATPHAARSLDEIQRAAVADAGLLARAGFDAIIIENMHDRPYVHGVQGPEIVAAMTRLALAVRSAAPRLPLGVQVLSGGNREALAVALAADASFIRCENFVFAHVADEGLLPAAEAGPLLRYRRLIGAAHLRILADVRKKHASHAITADLPIADMARAAEFFGADGVIVTGAATARPADPRDIRAVREATSLPLLVGSGVTPHNLAAMLEHADAAIVGSSIKRAGAWSGRVDLARCRRLVQARDRLARLTPRRSRAR